MEKRTDGAGPAGTPVEEQTDSTEPARESAPILLETIAARVPEPVVVVDSSADIVTGNDQLAAMFDRSAASLTGRPLQSLFPELTLEALAENCSETDVDEYITCEGVSDDDEIWVELTFDRHQWDDETFYVGVVHDVTQRREREQMLEQYERIVETVDDGVYTLDESFTIETVNSAVESMTGHSESELVGSSATLLADDDVIDRAATLSQQLLSGERDFATLTTSLETASGDRLPIETRFSTYPLQDGGYRQVGVVRDISDRRRFERTLAALHDSTRELLHAETKAEVGELIVETATDVMDLSAATIYLFDRAENVLRQSATAGEYEPAGAEQRTVAPGNGHLWDVFVENERATFGSSGDATGGHPFGTGDESGLSLPLDDHGVFSVVLDPDDQDARTAELIELLAASAEAALARVDRETTLREREIERREQNRKLRRLEQVNAIIRRIDQVLVDAETCEEIEQAVCEQLAESRWFSFAWVGRRDASKLVPRTWAGGAASYLDGISLTTAGEGGAPAVRTARSESMTVVSSVADDFRREQWRTDALSRDFQSAISVPLKYDDFMYGVLTVYADQQSRFDETLQSVFAELGSTIANALREIESRQRRAAETVLELELSLSAPESPTSQLAQRVDGPVICEGVVPQGDDSTRLFLRIPDGATATVRERGGELTRIDSIRAVTDDGASELYEAAVSGSTVGQTLADQGARVRSLRADDDSIAVTVHLAPDTDVRQFVEHLQRRYPDTQLVARREEQSAIRTEGGVQSALVDRLTDRQFEVLRTAYLGGFFDWPRTITGQEIGEMMDVSQPTVNRHLRVSERKLLDLIFEGL